MSQEEDVLVSPHESPFRWNAGAWFGSTLGCSVWLLAGGIVLVSIDPWVAVVWLSGFVLCAATTVLLWTQRQRVRAYSAYQRSFLVIGTIGLASILVAHLSGGLARLSWGGVSGPLAAYAALLVFPGLMLRFHLREHAARQANAFEAGEPRAS
jgi:hypothetical protein